VKFLSFCFYFISFFIGSLIVFNDIFSSKIQITCWQKQLLQTIYLITKELDMKVFSVGMLNLIKSKIRYLKENHKDVLIENNFEQVIALAKLGELERLCIFMDVWNCPGATYNGRRAQGAAELIHEIDLNIPILIWDGREYEPPFEMKDEMPFLQVTGIAHPIKNKNELYLSFDYFKGPEIWNKITSKFFDKTLTKEDVELGECIKFDLINGKIENKLIL